MERAYAPEGPRQGEIVLDKDEAHHLTRVRRVEEGAHVVAFDGAGSAWLCRLEESGKNHALLRVEQRVADGTERFGPELWLGTAVPKGDRFDWIVEKATELGVDRLVPLDCERSVVQPRTTKLDRLRRAVVEACKQCGRNRAMEIDEPRELAEFLGELAPNDLGLFADHGSPGMLACLRSFAGAGRIVICVGPEGGWTPAERVAAKRLDWRPVSLGPHVLRVETAAVAAAAVVRESLSG